MAYTIKALFSVITIISIAGINSKVIESGKYYHIESHDGNLISIGGANSRNVKVVTEEPQGTSPRQKFWIGSGETHEIMPEMQNTFGNLLLDLDLTSSLVFQQNRNYRRHQWWKITNVEGDKYVIQNDRSGQCLSTRGKDTQLFGTICDLSSSNQTWTFHLATLLN